MNTIKNYSNVNNKNVFINKNIFVNLPTLATLTYSSSCTQIDRDQNTLLNVHHTIAVI